MSVGGINKYTLDKPPDLRKSSLKNFREEGVWRVTGRDSVVLDRVGKSCFFNWGHSGRKKDIEVRWKMQKCVIFETEEEN